MRCASCGTAPWEWYPAAGGSKDAYEGAVHMCWGCYHRENVSKDSDLGPGARATLVPKKVAEARRERAARGRRPNWIGRMRRRRPAA